MDNPDSDDDMPELVDGGESDDDEHDELLTISDDDGLYHNVVHGDVWSIASNFGSSGRICVDNELLYADDTVIFFNDGIRHGSFCVTIDDIKIMGYNRILGIWTLNSVNP